MNIILGLVIAAVGALFITGGRAKSDFGLYRLLVARSRILWGDRAQRSVGASQFCGMRLDAADSA